MDPFARRQMWDCIAAQRARAGGCSVVLTTHLMEEAEALSDRVGIQVNGRMTCLGSTQHLKSQYGAGYELELKLDAAACGGDAAAAVAAAKEFVVQALCAGAATAPTVMEEHDLYLKFSIGRLGTEGHPSLGAVFGRLEQEKGKLHVEDYSVNQTSLEQIFIKFAKLQPDLNAATDD